MPTEGGQKKTDRQTGKPKDVEMPTHTNRQ